MNIQEGGSFVNSFCAFFFFFFLTGSNSSLLCVCMLCSCVWRDFITTSITSSSVSGFCVSSTSFFIDGLYKSGRDSTKILQSSTIFFALPSSSLFSVMDSVTSFPA